jgi:hypothetical protein
MNINVNFFGLFSESEDIWEVNHSILYFSDISNCAIQEIQREQ